MSNSELDKLKAIKAPWWSRWMGAYRAKRRARARLKYWHHITVVTLWARLDGRAIPSYVHLYEQGNGRRRVKFTRGAGLSRTKDEYPEYNYHVVPWLHHALTTEYIKQYAEHTKAIPTKWLNAP